MSRLLLSTLCAVLVGSTPLTTSAADSALPTVELSAEGHALAANDLATAEAYVEHTGAEPAAVARQVNATIATALKTAESHPSVRVKTAGTSTWPVYASNSRTISAWRMRSSLRLESRDLAALSTLAGELQQTLAIANLHLQPAPESLSKASDMATVEAIDAFGQRARLVAGTLGKQYRIKHLSISAQGRPAPLYRARAMASDMAAAAPAPIEAGDSSVVIQVHGSIELID
ncbi:MAG: SIMPL domain-containing protein [Rhodocyclaceae bacterium]|nr:SIMPL domain-containing protein [Rhodocyclaceae bacterium]